VKKLKLNVEDLAVDSFELAMAEESCGTVQGAEATNDCSQYCGWTRLEYYLGGTWMNP
jgi:hypothetical protein